MFILYVYYITFKHVVLTIQANKQKLKYTHNKQNSTQGAKVKKLKSSRSVFDQAMKSRGLLKPPFLFMYCL